MDPRSATPIDFFSEWFKQPIEVADHSVVSVVAALDRHPIAQDQTGQDYVMPIGRSREYPGRFRIYGENQDIFYCFVYEGDQFKIDPPVYFESCLNLQLDYAINPADILDNEHVLVANRFSDFLWQILGHHICIRMESGGQFVETVTGIVCDRKIQLDDSFIKPLRKDFPTGYTCFVRDDVICIPDWGAAFRTARSRELFMAQYLPSVSREWA